MFANSLQTGAQVAFLQILANSYKFLQTLTTLTLKTFEISCKFFHIVAKPYKLLLIPTNSCNFITKSQNVLQIHTITYECL